MNTDTELLGISNKPADGVTWIFPFKIFDRHINNMIKRLLPQLCNGGLCNLFRQILLKEPRHTTDNSKDNHHNYDNTDGFCFTRSSLPSRYQAHQFLKPVKIKRTLSTIQNPILELRYALAARTPVLNMYISLTGSHCQLLEQLR